MQIVVFEDERVADLAPITLARPAFAISCGSRRLVDLLAELGPPVHAVVRTHLKALVTADFPELATVSDNLAAARPGPTLWVNARLVPSRAAAQQLAQLIAAGRPGAILAATSGNHVAGSGAEGEVSLETGETLAAAFVAPGANPAAVLSTGQGSFSEGGGAPRGEGPARSTLDLRTDSALPLFQDPHDVIREHLTTLSDHLSARIASGRYREVGDGLFVAENVRLGQYLVSDASAGPIVLDEGVSVGPFTLLSGPCYLGPKCRVIEHAAIKHGSSLGHTTKIGGEVEASIIEAYSNKQHHGFLGHSYLGSWINLGAGTSNSDLKNTYGQVNMEYGGRRVATGMQFVGAIVGDYAKTAINTSIFTGKVIGVGSMVYGFVTTNVPSFVNYARLFGQVSEAPVEVLVSTQRRMFARRGVEQRPCDIQLLRDIYALTAAERAAMEPRLAIEPLSL
ncbi:MAG TPA: putative sugar nucleotidyl transferase [Pirellulales bacterium]|nr:putative sugar nucleotidyl transferase [Pirellulales bacterium]